MKKIVLVTGGNGVLGAGVQAIQNRYKQLNFVFPRQSELDLLSSEQTQTYVEQLMPAYILHLAAVSGGIGLSMSKPADLLRDNVLMNFNILEAARRVGVSKLVMTLSSGMYPEQVKLPISERSIHDGKPHASNYSYAFAKRLIQPSIVAYRQQYGLNVIGLVPNGIYGKHADFELNSSAMWASLLRRSCEGLRTANDIIVWGDGSQLREHTYSEDMARAFIWCMLNYSEEEILNVGSTEELSVRDIAVIIADTVGIDRERLCFDTSKPVGIHRKGFNNESFMKISNFQFMSFESGIREVAEWYKLQLRQN